MDPVGLAVGVAGLAGLFSSVMDAIDRAKDYRSFAADSKALDAQFDGYGAQLAHWGRQVGLDNGQFSANHRARLDPQILSAAEQLLQVAKEVLVLGEPSRGKAKVATRQVNSKPANSRLQKLGWALGGKADQSKNVRLFGQIVQQLCELIPSQPTNGTQLGNAEETSCTPLEAHPSLQDFLTEIRKMNSRMIAERKDYLQHELTAWLLGHQVPNETYDESVRKRLPGTCNWIFDQPQYIDWALKKTSESMRPLLWIHGHAGFGKTILCAQIVQRLIETRDRPVAYFFFSSNFDSRDDPYAAFRSCVLQLISKYPAAFELACDKWHEMADQVVASRHVIIQLLRQILVELPWCTLVIDGLDECTAARKEQGNVERFLLDMRGIMTETTRVLIVSRDEPEIRRALECDGSKSLSQFNIRPEHVQDDTKILSTHLVNTKLPNKTDEMRKDLSERLSSRCDGQFIWLMMQQASLRRGSNFKALKRAIEETPIGLDQLYQRNWDSIMVYGERDREQAFALLRWAAFSSRPLAIGEMAEAILLDETLEDFPVDELPDSIDDDYINTEIIGLCGPLLEVRGQDKDQPPQLCTIHIAHFSIKEYLICRLPIRNLRSNETLRVSNERAHRSFLCRLCLVYITCRTSWDDTKSTHFTKSFRKYASLSWFNCIEYSNQDEMDSKLLDLASDFMTETHPCWSSWTQWLDEHDKDDEAIEDAKEPSGRPEPLYYALRFDLHEFASKLALSRSSSSRVEVKGRSTLHLACLKGNIKVAATLLRGEAASLLNSRGLWGRTPLYSGVLCGHEDMVQMLLEMGADVSIPNNEGLSLLLLAASCAHVEIVRILLDRGADLSISDHDGWSPLLSAAYGGHLETVRLLLDRGSNISIPLQNGWTPLALAVSNGHLETARLLLDRGSDISLAIHDGWTPLAIAASDGYLEIVQLLIEKGANISIASKSGWTPLEAAAGRGHIEVARLLLDSGADISAQSEEGWTALARAADRGHTEVVRLLLDRGTHHSPKSNRGWTPLSLAAGRGHVEVARLLLDRGANSSLLSIATESDHPETVMLLLERLTADLAETDSKMQTGIDESPLPNNTPALRRTSLENEINTADSFGRTPLWYACRNGNIELVRFLTTVAHPEPMIPDYFALTPLYAAVIHGHYSIVKSMLEFMERCLVSGESFNYPINSKALHSTSSEVSQLLRDHSQKYGIALELEDLPPNPNSPWASVDRKLPFCDACIKDLSPNMAYYYCSQCVATMLICICQECMESGSKCLDDSHELRFAKPRGG
ncbi:unnamed protein product [Clonostachys rosea]|uniref:NACHT domain-containing protein n=1 Tax=Bionectria ochroleuca TaxID=29856 RepID=A0ABY6UEG1_BIOOC|nr:unnamed protein product [Clonostachys rosea]